MAEQTEFTCPGCNDTYKVHWRDERDPVHCKSCADERRGDCRLSGHGTGSREHLCTYRIEEPGGPCRWCGQPVPLDRTKPCPRCWESFEDMTIADVKAVFATDAENTPEGSAVFDIKPIINPGGDHG